MKQKIVLVASVIVGLLAAFITGSYISSKEEALLQQQAAFEAKHKRVDVVVLTRTLPAGATLTSDDLGMMSFPERALREQTIRPQGNISLRLVGRKLAVGVTAKRPLQWSDIVGGAPDERGLSGRIRKNMRALSVSVSGATSVSHMVRPTDRVDVLGTFSLPSKTVQGATELVTMTILQNVLVLATGQELSNAATRGNYALVTLEVTPREAEVLTFAEQMRGRLTLTLRHPEDLSHEKALEQVNLEQIRSSLESLNTTRQRDVNRVR